MFVHAKKGIWLVFVSGLAICTVKKTVKKKNKQKKPKYKITHKE